MASVSASSSSMADNHSATIHPTLMGIAEAMKKVEQQRKERLDLAWEFLEINDAWAKTKAGTAVTATVTPLIESIATLVMSFAIGTTQANENPPQDRQTLEERDNNRGSQGGQNTSAT